MYSTFQIISMFLTLVDLWEDHTQCRRAVSGWTELLQGEGEQGFGQCHSWVRSIVRGSEYEAGLDQKNILR